MPSEIEGGGSVTILKETIIGPYVPCQLPPDIKFTVPEEGRII